MGLGHPHPTWSTERGAPRLAPARPPLTLGMSETPALSPCGPSGGSGQQAVLLWCPIPQGEGSRIRGPFGVSPKGKGGAGEAGGRVDGEVCEGEGVASGLRTVSGAGLGFPAPFLVML